MSRQLVPEQMVEKSQKRTGLDRFDSDSFWEGLRIWTADHNRNERPEQMVDESEELVVGALAARLKTTQFLGEHPELLSRPIEKPVFVIGVPRTGTTLLSNLLASDPARRSPLTWEIDDPVPPPTTAMLYNDPRALARLEQERAFLAQYPGAGKYYRGSAIYPNECLYFTNSDFKGLWWEARGIMPNYRNWMYSDEIDLTSTYLCHKRFLQLLQAEAPGIWNLKQPSHGLFLETLLTVYPDARLVWAHRDPVVAVGSYCSLMTMALKGSTGISNPDWVAQNYGWQAVQHADRIMDFRDKFGEGRVIDVHYTDLMHDPIAAMRNLYLALGDEFTPAAQGGMQGWLDDNPQQKFGRHEYALGDFGLSVSGVRDSFERYLTRYKIAAEG